jgi:hypothetical protein
LALQLRRQLLGDPGLGQKKNGLGTETGFGPLGTVRVTVFVEPALTQQEAFLQRRSGDRIGERSFAKKRYEQYTTQTKGTGPGELSNLFLPVFPRDLCPQIDFPPNGNY